MIIYNVTVNPDRNVIREWLAWMKDIHIPDVMETGCFDRFEIFKIVNDLENPTFSIHYYCKDLATYEKYRTTFASALQEKHTKRYAGKFTASRQILESI